MNNSKLKKFFYGQMTSAAVAAAAAAAAAVAAADSASVATVTIKFLLTFQRMPAAEDRTSRVE